MEKFGHRKRISSNLIGIKVFIIVCVLFVTLIVASEWNSSGSTLLLGFALTLCIFGGLWLYSSTRKLIEFDEVNNKLFIISLNTKTETEIPLKNVEKIVFSAFGLSMAKSASFSYLIVYRDLENKKSKVRVFPKPFSTDMDRVIKAAKLHNPGLETTKWSVGLIELLD